MAELINLVTWTGINVTPLDDALVYDAAVGDSGILYGANITAKNVSTLHISAGHGIVCGRKFTISDGDITVELAPSGTRVGRVYVHLDLSNTSEPISLLTETGTSLSPVVQQEDVNVNNGVYEFNMATFSLDTMTISNVEDIAPRLDGSGKDVAKILGDFATVERTEYASKDYAADEYLVLDGLFYKATAQISRGNHLVPSGNITQTTVGDELSSLNADLANARFRDYSLGNQFTAEQAQMIAAGDFKNLVNGGYWNVDGKKVRIVDNTNWYMHRGDTEFTKSHLVIMCDENVLKSNGSTTRYMKDSNDTTGAYASTKYRATYRAQCKKFFTDFFGASHIASYRGLIATATASGRASNWAWNDCDVELPTENMIFGSPYWGNGAGNGYNGSSFYSQLQLFKLAPEFIVAKTAAGERENYWEQDVVSATSFAYVNYGGGARDYAASHAGIGLRPFALLI